MPPGEASARGDQISQYHIEAGIAGHYATAPSFAETDWQAILDLYNLLVIINPSPFAKLNRIVVFSKIHGVEAGLEELAATNTPAMKKHHLFYTIRADLSAAAGLKDCNTRPRRSARCAPNQERS